MNARTSTHFVSRVFLGLTLAFLNNALKAEDYFLTIGGGYTPQQNQASLEANVLFFQKLLSEKHASPFQHRIFFADGLNDQADLQVLSAARPSTEPLKELIGRLHRRGPPGFAGRSVEYRNHQVPNVAGANSPKLIHEAISEIAGKAKKGDRLLIYVTAHGGEGPDDDPRNTTISCWNKESITREEFTQWLEEVPDSVPVIMVMAQCYCGGFADTIFETDGKREKFASKPRVGFFAQQHNLPAAGCRPDIEHDQEFSSYFWGTIAGQSRNGEPITGADINGDSKISFDEAFANAVIIGDTIDIPLKTSDVLLHRFSRIPDYVLIRDRSRRNRPANTEDRPAEEPQRTDRPESEGSDEKNEQAPSESEAPTAESQEAKAPAEQTTPSQEDDSKLPGRMEGSIESLIQNADPTSRRIVTELCGQLQIPLADTVQQLMDRYMAQQRARGGAFRGPGRRSSSGRRELLAAIEKQWPELADPEAWSKSELLTKDPSELLKSIEALPEYAVYQERLKQREQQSKDADTTELRTIRFRRLIDTLENIVLARNLSAASTPEIAQKYEDMRKLETTSLSSGLP